MRSRAARLTLGTAAWIAIGAVAYFLISTERQIGARRGGVAAFDARARATAETLADARAAQQAYVAAGQGVEFWMPRVSERLDAASQGADTLRAAALSTRARAALMEASAHLTEFGNLDRRAREYLRSGETLMAGDVVFSEGAERATTAARLVEQARLAERAEVERLDRDQRRLQASALAGAGLLALLVIGLLAFRSAAVNEEPAFATLALPAPEHADDAPATSERGAEAAARTQAAAAGAPPLPRGSAPVLAAAAQVCTDLARAGDLDEVARQLGRAAEIMDASGLVVWAATSPNGDLEPALAHGYRPETLARMPMVPRSADNAAAAAYRSGKLQIVLSRPGGPAGAVVAPLLGSGGCLGALTAEIRHGSEASDAVQALAALFAAQLAVVLVPAAPAAEAASAESRVASA